MRPGGRHAVDVVETRELRYFVAVAEEAHVGRAADLLVRTPRGVTVTTAGETLLRITTVIAWRRTARRQWWPGWCEPPRARDEPRPWNEVPGRLPSAWTRHASACEHARDALNGDQMSIHPAGWYQDPSDASQQRYWSGTGWTADQRPAPMAPFAAPPPSTSAGHTGRWYFVTTLLSGGVLAAVPFFHAASRLERPRLNLIGAAMVGGGVSVVALGGDGPGVSTASTLISLVLMVVATGLLVGIRREVYSTARVPEPPSANAGARARVEQPRLRRRGRGSSRPRTR